MDALRQNVRDRRYLRWYLGVWGKHRELRRALGHWAAIVAAERATLRRWLHNWFHAHAQHQRRKRAASKVLRTWVQRRAAFILELGFGRWRRATVAMCGAHHHSSASPPGMRARSPSPLPATPGLPKAPCISLDTMDFLVHISRKVWLRESWRVWRQAVIFLRPKPVVVVTATRPLASVWRGTSLHRALARRHLRWALTVWRNASQDSAPRALPACLCARGCVCSQPRPRAQRPEPGGARASSPGPLLPQQAPPRDTDHPYGTWTVQLETGSPRDAYHDRVPLSGQHERTGRLLGGRAMSEQVVWCPRLQQHMLGRPVPAHLVITPVHALEQRQRGSPPGVGFIPSRLGAAMWQARVSASR